MRERATDRVCQPDRRLIIVVVTVPNIVELRGVASHVDQRRGPLPPPTSVFAPESRCRPQSAQPVPEKRSTSRSMRAMRSPQWVEFERHRTQLGAMHALRSRRQSGASRNTAGRAEPPGNEVAMRLGAERERRGDRVEDDGRASSSSAGRSGSALATSCITRCHVEVAQASADDEGNPSRPLPHPRAALLQHGPAGAPAHERPLRGR